MVEKDSQVKRKLDPEENKIQISIRKPPRHFIYLSKIFLNKFDIIELHALGEATQTAVQVAENLTRQGQTTIVKIQTEQAIPNKQERPNAWKTKIIVHLKKTKDFKFEDKQQ